MENADKGQDIVQFLKKKKINIEYRSSRMKTRVF